MANEVKSLIVLLTLGEAAERLRKTDSQLRWMIHQNKAPKSALIGGRRMFREADVEAFIEAAFEEASA
jgi:excisionase family DNA binding protein